MVKVKVMKSFVDIHTHQVHPVGEVFEANEERVSEIKSVDHDLIQVVTDEAPVKKTRKKVDE